MSYIRKELCGVNYNTDIEKFLISEGFNYGSGAQGEGIMYYVVSGDLYSVWFALCRDHFSLYAEYECGGEVGNTNYYFDEDNASSFFIAYKDSIEWAKKYIR